MSIQPGETIPDVSLQCIDGDIKPAQTGALFAGRKVVLFGVPGAFTPTCSNKHLPGYTEHFDAFRQSGITVMCLAVNDGFVMQAWAASQQVPAGLLMLADGNGSFTRALGLELDGTAFGMGLRARRFALYAEDGVVRLLELEAPGEFRVTSAEAILALVGG
ncbi:peroxiredoxin [Rhodanobacter sp. AS-Z3]|uniref:peroxiredoxin n=1 Tax=Rhodanobacter sp. AS-Z3 TaxID=3031330 RepID=UPI002478BE74|nr:peroxiredoxin [Rhodanobacter sp. AS-Z3]WEN13528.1 peroxiredoxin [Rhodanobacter sp. AS-Z3]